jgi:hypothetical protein
MQSDGEWLCSGYPIALARASRNGCGKIKGLTD